MITNIFRSAYEQPENKLTYCFFSLLEHLDFTLATALISESGISVESFERLRVELLYGGGEGNPDGSVTLEGPQTNLQVYFENKTYRRSLELDQIKRHLRARMDSFLDSRLLVITTNIDDARELATLGDRRICFMTWHQVAEAAERLSQGALESKDRLLLSQFCEYLETSGEAWRARMPDSKLIQANAQHLALRQERNLFLTECFRLMDALREDLQQSFGTEITAARTLEHWGRVGNECDLRRAPLGQWLFFGVYFDPQDHRIDFTIPHQAEFAIFLDFDPKQRDPLRKLPGIEGTIAALCSLGFEFNFPGNDCGNAWRVCFWRVPMVEYAGASVSKLRSMFEAKLTTLFESDFYRLASGA